ncbi:MAG: hypothetical protein WD894_17855 [Pirellulales bacterium]
MFPLLFALFARRECLGVLSFLLLAGLLTAPAEAAPFSFARMTSGYGIAGSAALDSGQLAFAGRGQDNVWGIHIGPVGGPYQRVVDDSSVVSGAASPLDNFYFDFGFDAGRVAFYGGRNESTGIYLYADGSIHRIADRTTAIPGTAKTFGVLHWPPSIDNGLIAFDGQSGTTPGVKPLRGAYLARNGELSRIADTTMHTPGDTRNFSDSFGSSTIDGNKVAFIGNRFDRPGIYLHDLETGTQSRLVDTNTSVPGHEKNFSGFRTDDLDLDGDKVAFIGTAYPMAGVYVADGDSGSLTTIGESDMLIPGTDSERFESGFTSVSIDEGRVAFGYLSGGPPILQSIGAESEPEFYGVYSNLSGSLAKVIATGDTLDEKLVLRAYVGRQGLQGDQILTEVSFADGTEALYVATLIPEPGTLVLLASGCLAVAVMARSHRRSRKFGIGHAAPPSPR